MSKHGPVDEARSFNGSPNRIMAAAAAAATTTTTKSVKMLSVTTLQVC
jgi:hypothetical protein